MTIAVVLLGGILGILNSTMVAVGIGVLAEHFGASLSTIGWVSTGFLLAVTVTIPFTAWAVERFGSKRMWLAGLSIFLAASLGCGLAWSSGSLIAFRVVQGVGAGILDPLVLTLLARAAGPHRAGRVMGLMAAVLSLGPVLGPIVGGVVLQDLDWRWLFLLNLPLGVLAYVLAVRVLPGDQPEPGQHSRLDVIGLALLGPGLAALLLSLTKAADAGTVTNWQALTPLLAGLALLAAYAVHALRPGRTPLIDLRLFARGGFAASVTVIALVGLATFSNLFVLPLYYQRGQAMNALSAGLLLAPFGVGGAVAALLGGRISDRIGSRNLAVAGSALAAVGALTFTRIGAEAGNGLIVAVSLAVGLGLGLAGPPAMGALYRTLPPTLVPQGSSVLYMLNQLGAAVGIAVMALILQTTGTDALTGFHLTYVFVLGSTVIILAASLGLPAKALVAQGESR